MHDDALDGNPSAVFGTCLSEDYIDDPPACENKSRPECPDTGCLSHAVEITFKEHSHRPDEMNEENDAGDCPV